MQRGGRLKGKTDYWTLNFDLMEGRTIEQQVHKFSFISGQFDGVKNEFTFNTSMGSDLKEKGRLAYFGKWFHMKKLQKIAKRLDEGNIAKVISYKNKTVTNS